MVSPGSTPSSSARRHSGSPDVGDLPVLKPREVVAILQGLGFAEVRQRGSHKQFRHPDGRVTTVPFHQGRDISPSLLRKIAQDIAMDVRELVGQR
jgi:predicted RNA binding protein YcfA (HicA-like mRNA interferase family)